MHMQTLFFFAVFNKTCRQLDGKMTLWLLILNKMIAPSFLIPPAPDIAELRRFPSYFAVVLNYHKLRLCTASPETSGGGDARLRKKKKSHFIVKWKKQCVIFDSLDPRRVETSGRLCHEPSVCFCAAVLVFVASAARSDVNARRAPLHLSESHGPTSLSKKEPTKTNSRKWTRFNANDNTACENNACEWCNWFVT